MRGMTNTSSAWAARQAARDVDGKYSEMGHAEPSLELPASAPTSNWARRREELSGAGYLPAIATRASIDPATAEYREQWWDEHFAGGEYAHQDGTFPKMPDDNSPSMGLGGALSGHRRTYRKAYTGGGTTLRMPSAASIRRFASDPKNRTFDIPVALTAPDGSQVSGWVRVSGAGHTWDAHALGFVGTDQHAVGEAVASVLEARRPEAALAAAGDLIAKHKARVAQQGVVPAPVKSSWIQGMAFDGATSTMVMTTNGRQYGYAVDREEFEAVRDSYSPGRVFGRLIKNTGRRVEINDCPRCGRFYSTATHTCPPDQGKRLGSDPYAAATRQRAASVLGKPAR